MLTVLTPTALADCSQEDLLVLIGGGSRPAFAAFYDCTSTRVFGVVSRILLDRVLSEEVTLEVFLEAWQRAPRFDPLQSRALAWLLTIACRRALDIDLATPDAA